MSSSINNPKYELALDGPWWGRASFYIQRGVIDNACFVSPGVKKGEDKKLIRSKKSESPVYRQDDILDKLLELELIDGNSINIKQECIFKRVQNTYAKASWNAIAIESPILQRYPLLQWSNPLLRLLQAQTPESSAF